MIIDVAVRQILPPPGVRTTASVWENVYADLDAHAMDIAVVPGGDVPARFATRTLYEEELVIAMRRGRSFAKDPTLDRSAVCGTSSSR